MSDRMNCIPFEALLNHLTGEYRRSGTIFGIPESKFYRKGNNNSFRIFGERCDNPAGPAAGPHTQLSQNIISSYLCGGRFMELKTVQKMDSLEFDKPCIDARDEAYNTEWSTELSLENARDEYTKAWIILHLLEGVFNLGTDADEKGFVFNMSIGYDLDGIKTSRMDRFIEGLINASGEADFSRYLETLSRFTRSDAFKTAFADASDTIKGIADRISPRICRSVTLSTMHGCPPEEQESICRYLLSEKNLHTYVKLNPTLLGYERARESLDARGYGYIGLGEDTFLHDLQYPDALSMLKNLRELADEKNLSFGVKLSNTLASVNPGDVLPGEEQYMSGRALFPLTLTLADMLQTDMPGKLPVSFAGGVSVYNASTLFATGIRPLTCATELLKPSGYLRLAGIAEAIDENAPSDAWHMEEIDRKALSRLGESFSGSPFFAKEFRGTDRPAVDTPLEPFDCYVAPCVETCPIGQNVPEYIHLLGEGRIDEALACIYDTNPLPSVTGTICDHKCMTRCTRLDYEGSVLIRDMKRIAAERGSGFADTIGPPEKENGLQVAIIGAGPAGLAASFFLRRAGFAVTVFEKEKSAGGIVRNVLPGFRITSELLNRDISRIRAMGVEFMFGVDDDITLESLKSRGYKYIFIGIGASSSRQIDIQGEAVVHESLKFLWTYKNDPGSLKLGAHVAVIGGGNTAMDSARAAVRVPGVETVYILYRRTKDQMPADMEEFENALADGVIFKPLLLPEHCPERGVLDCRVMVLGKAGPDGRPSPVATDERVTIPVDTIISAAGEHVDYETLNRLGLSCEPGTALADPETMETNLTGVFLGGDARQGPCTVVESMADGKKAAEEMIRRSGSNPEYLPDHTAEQKKARIPEILKRRGYLYDPKPPEEDDELTQREANRCLQCSLFCNKCVEVCPNRANIAIPVEGPEFHNLYQIIHIDPFCNECGNCATFCPHDGKPYKDKLTLYSGAEELVTGENPGFSFDGGNMITLRTAKDVEVVQLPVKDGKIITNDSIDSRFIRVIETIITDYGYLIETVTTREEIT